MIIEFLIQGLKITAKMAEAGLLEDKGDCCGETDLCVVVRHTDLLITTATFHDAVMKNYRTSGVMNPRSCVTSPRKLLVARRGHIFPNPLGLVGYAKALPGVGDKWLAGSYEQLAIHAVVL